MTHVHVKRCTVVTVMNAFKIGTETANDISDILVEDCTFCMPDIYPVLFQEFRLSHVWN